MFIRVKDNIYEVKDTLNLARYDVVKREVYGSCKIYYTEDADGYEIQFNSDNVMGESEHIDKLCEYLIIVNKENGLIWYDLRNTGGLDEDLRKRILKDYRNNYKIRLSTLTDEGIKFLADVVIENDEIVVNLR